MKKTYINPNIEVVKMKINQHLLETSGQVGLKGGAASEWGSHEMDGDDW